MILAKTKIICFIPVIIFVFGLTYAKDDLPSNFKKCGRKNQDFQKCLIEAASIAVANLVNGLPEFEIKPIDPLVIPYLAIGDNNSSPLNFKQMYSDIKVQGLATMRVKSIKANVAKCKFLTEVHIEKMEILSNYELDGKVLLLPIIGKGRANITTIDNTVKTLIQCEEYEKDGHIYQRPLKFKSSIKPKRAFYKLENLFNGDKTLSENMHIFLNENWELVFNEFRGEFEKAISNEFIDITEKIYSRIPVDVIYLN